MLLVLGLALLLALTAYISTLTYALRGYSRAQLAQQAIGPAGRAWLDWLTRNESELLISHGVVRLSLCALVLFGVPMVMFGESGADGNFFKFSAQMGVSLVLIAFFAVGLPHALSAHLGEALIARSLRVIAAVQIVLWPITRPLLLIESLLLRALGRSLGEDAQTQSDRIEKEILDAVEAGELQGAVDEDEKEIIQSVFELRDTTVSAIMTPRTEVVALPVEATFEETRSIMRRTGHSRIPVYEDSLDRIIGVLYMKDLLGVDSPQAFDARRLLRKVPYVPETKPVAELLDELRHEKVHMAIVLDEYSGTAGVITIEDILEELVGEIADEFDHKAPPAIRRLDDHTLDVDARVHVHEINSELDVALPEDAEYDTIGGFVFSTLGKIPRAGEEFTHKNLHFRVMDAEARKINRLRISVAREPLSA